jgi:hypothetical protein
MAGALKVFIVNLEGIMPLTVYVNEPNNIVVNVPGHPFYIQNSSSTYDDKDLATGVTNNGIDSGTIIFTPTVPGTYYYACKNHTTCGNTINAIFRPVEVALAEVSDNPCYCKGTSILTNKGYIKIEDIKINDLVIREGIITPSGMLEKNFMVVPVIWISSFKVKILNSKTRPICIRKNTFGEHYPCSDLYVSPLHKICINDNFVNSITLIHGEDIYQDNECESVEYYHLKCEDHSAIYANGLLSESYLCSSHSEIFEKS